MADKKLITQIFDKHFDRIYKFFYYKTLSREIAEDLTSETFLKFVEQIKSFESNINDPEKYLYGIARITFLNHLKTKYQFQTESIEEYPNLTEEVEILDKSKKTIEDIAIELLPKLPEKQRVIMEMRLVQKKSLLDITLELEKDMNYVKTTQKRAIKNLKILLECTPLGTI